MILLTKHNNDKNILFYSSVFKASRAVLWTCVITNMAVDILMVGILINIVTGQCKL